MEQRKNLLAALGYFILGLIVLLAAVQILRGVLWIVYWIATTVLGVALVGAVGFVLYLLVSSVLHSREK